MSDTPRPFHAVHEEMKPLEEDGPSAWWPDGTTTYLLATRQPHPIGWTVADETATVLRAIDAIRSGTRPTADELDTYLTHTRRLAACLAAVQDELLLIAREPDEQGRAVSWREIAEALAVHFTTVRQRHGRMVTEGQLADQRAWLTEDTDRAPLYAAREPQQPAHRPDA